MAQFIRKNKIDILSSVSRPASTSSASLEECIETNSSSSDPKINSPNSQDFQTIRIGLNDNPSIPSLIYDNYTLLPSKYKNKEQYEQASSPELTSQTFRSALDTYHRPSSTTANLSSPGYELDTQEPFQDYDPLTNDISVETITSPVIPPSQPLPNQIISAPIVTYTILSKLWQFIKYLMGLESRRQPINDPERQPLISPPHEQYGEDEDDQPHTGPAYDLLSRYRYFFITLTILITIALLTIILVTGDSHLLAIIFRALLCYLLGSNAEYLLGEGFCPAT